jgi:NAD(P)-dependent dehydrogenase (short-subunit alcohol dehydrogenase family)
MRSEISTSLSGFAARKIEPKLTMAPLFFFRCGRAVCISITEPTTFTSNALSQSARAVSASSRVAQTGRWVYPVSKAAILQLTRNQAMDLAPDGIRVNAVSPGWTWSNIMVQLTNGNRAKTDGVAKPLIVLHCAANFCVEGGFANLAPYTVERYGVSLGARASGLGQTANGFGKIIGPLSLSFIAGTGNLVTPQQTAAAVLPTFLFLAGCMVPVTLSFLLLAVETHGKAIEIDVQNERRF